jgi:hypothetical protein
MFDLFFLFFGMFLELVLFQICLDLLVSKTFVVFFSLIFGLYIYSVVCVIVGLVCFSVFLNLCFFLEWPRAL